MIKNMTTPTAALPGNSAPSFVASTGTAAFWRIADSHAVNRATVFGTDALGLAATTVHDVPRSVVTPIPNLRRVSELATKQDRPPRGIPR